jgi:very-short-patch-repair endonuclease
MPSRDGKAKAPFAQRLMLRSRQLRREATPAESALWALLRGSQVAGLKFRRQVPLGRFIADFLCAEAKLVVEVDGGVHRGRTDVDAVRDGVLKRSGLQVLRFTNDQAMRDPESVCAEIERVARQRLAGSSSPDPFSDCAEKGDASLNGIRGW